MNPRRLNTQINILREKRIKSDSGGETSQGWVRRHEHVPAGKIDVGAGESVQGTQVTPGTQTVFTVRWLSDIRESDRIEHNDQYEIKGLRDEDGKEQWRKVDAAKIPATQLAPIVEGPPGA
jgi:hypothetical protein